MFHEKYMINKIKRIINYIDNMGMRYILFRISYLIKTMMGLQIKVFPTNPDFKKYISLQEWKDNLYPFFFYGKEIKGSQKHPSEDLKKNLEDLKKGVYTFFNKTKIDLGVDYDWVTNPLTNYKYDINTHWSKIEDLSLEEIQSIVPNVDLEILEVLKIKNSVSSRTSYGGTAPKNVLKAVKNAKKRFLEG